MTLRANRGTAAGVEDAFGAHIMELADTVPMPRRHDAAAAAAEIVLYVERRCAQTPGLVGTVGQLAVPGGAINIIPGRCELTLDIRAADDATRDVAVSDIA